MPDFFGDWNPLFLGCAGDLAAHVLYRIDVPPRPTAAPSRCCSHTSCPVLLREPNGAERRSGCFAAECVLTLSNPRASALCSAPRSTRGPSRRGRRAAGRPTGILTSCPAPIGLHTLTPSAAYPTPCPPRPPGPKLVLTPAGMSAPCAIASVAFLRSTSSETMAIAVQYGNVCIRLAATTFDTATRSWRLRSRSSVF